MGAGAISIDGGSGQLLSNRACVPAREMRIFVMPPQFSPRGGYKVRPTRNVRIPRGLIIAAPSSGAGKTTVTLGLLRALARRGVAVQPFKCGPDYIDTAFHTAAARPHQRQSRHVGHAPAAHRAPAARCCRRCRGLHRRGRHGPLRRRRHARACGNGSTADLAALTGWPVVLVLDVAAQAETAAAVALGLKTYRRDIEIAGVILNRVGSPRARGAHRRADGAHRHTVSGGAATRRHRHARAPSRAGAGGRDARRSISVSRRIADAIAQGVDLDAARRGRAAR